MASLEPVFIAGPTAAGKSELALLLAEQIGGEVISVDSMQVYRGMDIGTAKPSAEERRRVRHHLIDVAEINEAFDAAQFARLANQAVGEIASRRRVPIFCGGTGLYFRAYTEGLGDAPSANRAIREELQKLPLETLLLELQEKDPETFDRIDRQNPRRVVRAVEVIRLTGRPFSVQRGEWTSAVSEPPTKFFVIRRDLADLRARIDLRVDWMFRAGLVEETRALLESGLEKNITAMQAIGYRQVVEHLRGERTLAETIDLVKIRTRQFAKRQMTWFKRQPGAQWLDWTSGTEAPELLAKLSQRL
jgi:tRNA dimethylallyltransferase